MSQSNCNPEAKFKVARWQWSKFGLVVELRTFTVPLTKGSVPEADSDAQHSLVRC